MEQNKKSGSPWLLLLTVTLGTLLVGIDRTVTNLALPKIILDFHISAATAGWVATIYIITSAVFIPIFGKLGDVYGDRSIFVAGMVGFILTSLLTAFSWSTSSLIAFRAFQGVFGASITPTAMAAITKGFTNRASRAQALGLWVSGLAGAAAIAPLLGGPLIDNFGWRSVFYINLPIGLLTIFLAFLYIHNDRIGHKQRLDAWGSIILGILLTAFVLVVDRGSSWGWLSPNSLICYVTVLLFSWILAVQQNKNNDPIIDFKLFRNTTTSSGLATTLLLGMSLYSLTILISLFAQQSLGYSATQTGYLYIPLVLPLFLISPFGAKISKYLAPRITIFIGVVGSALAVYLLSVSNISLGLRGVSLPLALFGIFYGITSAPLSTAIVSSVPKTHAGMISGLRTLVVSIGGAIGIALFTSIYSRNQLTGVTPSATFHTLYGISTVIILISAVVALFIKESSSDYA